MNPRARRPSTGSLVMASTLAAPADVVWAAATTPAGVNHELAPIVRMTIPHGWDGRALDAVAPGTALGRSWLLLGGVVPFEYDDLTIAEVGPGHRFLERSTMAQYRTWTHERTVADAPGGCRVVDRVSFTLRAPLDRVPGLLAVHARVLRALFGHRHRRLTGRYGAAAPAS